MVVSKTRVSGFIFLVAAPLLVSGCGDARRAIGYEKTAPDEFQVVRQAPLSLPPDFALRPPTPGAPRPQTGDPRAQARQAVTGLGPASANAQGRGTSESALLKRVGADQAHPDIRSLVNKETQALANEDRVFTDRLLFWRDPLPQGYNEQLDSAEESKRIRENNAQGNPVNEGETPIIKRQKRALLEGIL